MELAVADTGIGIAEHELPRLFERFHRIEGTKSRSFEGSGIGLALVHELVRMHGGAIRVASRCGEGTTVTIALRRRPSAHLPQDRVRGERTLASTAVGAAPYVEEALRWLPGTEERGAGLGDAPWSRSTRTWSTGSTAGGARASVVIVDDNVDMRSYLARILGQRWNVRTYADGAQALQGIRVALPDVVVTDIMMPNLDGYGLLRALRAEPGTGGVPVIMLSALAGESARIEGATFGADDYVVKPFSARELVARVGAQIDLARARGIATAERAQLRQLFMHAPVGIAIVEGPNHVYALANPSYCRITGRSAEQLLDRPGREALPELIAQGVLGAVRPHDRDRRALRRSDLSCDAGPGRRRSRARVLQLGRATRPWNGGRGREHRHLRRRDHRPGGRARTGRATRSRAPAHEPGQGRIPGDARARVA